MLPHILDLPDEVLDICLRELLPPIAIDFNDWFSVSEPHDLKGLMTLCKTFYRLSSPWVWRHVELSCRGPWRRAESSCNGRWKFLRDHAEVASHIRFLALDITHDANQKDVALLCELVPLMANLQVLRLSALENAIWEFYMPLLSGPHLHTLIINSHIPTEYIQGLSSLTSLRRLNMQGCSGTKHFLLERCQFLESLAISSAVEDKPIPWMTMAIPWATLRELVVYDDDGGGPGPPDDWYLILENHSSWKKSFPDTPSRLTELFIALQFSSVTLEHIKLLASFGPQLHRLWLAYLEEIDQEILEHVVDGFPHLHELHLLTLRENTLEDITWSVEPVAIAESLGKLSMLKRLNLNYVDPGPDEERDSEEWHRNVVRDLVPMIGRACKSLEFLEFYHDFPGSEICYAWVGFTILRDGNGAYESYLETEVDKSVFRPLTSGWDMGNYSCI